MVKAAVATWGAGGKGGSGDGGGGDGGGGDGGRDGGNEGGGNAAARMEDGEAVVVAVTVEETGKAAEVMVAELTEAAVMAMEAAAMAMAAAAMAVAAAVAMAMGAAAMAKGAEDGACAGYGWCGWWR